MLLYIADGSTPLHHVCYTGSHEMLALLLNSGADGMIPVYINVYMHASVSHSRSNMCI